MIQVRKLTKVYGETVAVDGISFDVPQGQILGLLGPNGAGKTTTMRVLTGFTPPTSGSAIIGGYDIQKDSRQVRQILGYLPESAPVYGEMTVKGFVEFFAEVKGLTGLTGRMAVSRALSECGLASVENRLLMNLSKGYRQRASLAQAILGDPKVVILDEPTVGLDPRQIREIRDLIRSMAEQRTVILSTHILPEVSLTCSRVLIINKGRIVASGTPDDMQSDMRAGKRLAVTVKGMRGVVREAMLRVPGVKDVSIASALGPDVDGAHTYQVITGEEDVRAELSHQIVQAGFGLLEMRLTGTSLEDLFIHIVADDTKEGENER